MECIKKIVVDSQGKTWLLYPDILGRVCYAACKSRHSLNEGSIDIEGLLKEFDLDIDVKDHIHLVAINTRNEIIYYRYSRESREWEKMTSCVPFSDGGEINNLKVISGMSPGGGLHVFCSVSSGGSIILHRHLLPGGECREHKIYITSNSRNNTVFDVSVNKHGKLFAAIYSSGSIYLKEFVSGRWQDRLRISDEKFRTIHSVILQQDYLVIGSRFGIHFIPKLYGNNRLAPITIAEGDYTGKGPVVIAKKNALFIAWAQQKGVRYRTSYDGGKSWSRVKEHHYEWNESPELYGFRSNFLPFIEARKVLGTRIPQLYVPFINMPMERISFPKKMAERIKNNGHYDCLMEGREKSRDTDIQDVPVEEREGLNISEEYKQDDRIRQLEEKVERDMRIIKEEIEVLKEEIKKDIEGEFKTILKELRDIKNSLPKTPGNVITQQMINRHLKKDG